MPMLSAAARGVYPIAPTAFHADGRILVAMNHQCRHLDLGQARADVVAQRQRRKALPQVDR